MQATLGRRRRRHGSNAWRNVLASAGLVVACGGGAATPGTTAAAVVVAPPGDSAAAAVPAAVTLGSACGDARLLAAPAELAAPGPWSVGARTILLDGHAVEVWYPAAAGSARGQATVRYDLRPSMPPAEAAKIPDADNAWLECACHRDLPLDETHGPYPVVLFLHGAGSFRAQSAFLATHWASRGFVVVAPDLPGAGLAALMGQAGGSPWATPALVLDLLAAAPGERDPLAFVRDHLGARVALVGHSLGSMLAATVRDRPTVAAVIAMAGRARLDGARPTLVLAGDHDGIAPAAGAQAAMADATPSSRLLVVPGAGHLAFSDLCLVGADRGGALAIARAHGVAVPDLIAHLATDGCRPADAPFAQTAPPIRAASAGFLEEQLRCDPAATAALAGLARQYPAVTWIERLAPR